MSEEEKAEAEDINTQYALTEKKLNEDSEKNETTMEGFLAYDISFIVDGEEVEPSGDVKVTMDFKEAAIPEGVSEDATVEVKHLKEDTSATDGVIVEDMSEKSTVETSEKTEIEKVELTVNSFSIFTVTWTQDGTERGRYKVEITSHYGYVDQKGRFQDLSYNGKTLPSTWQEDRENNYNGGDYYFGDYADPITTSEEKTYYYDIGYIVDGENDSFNERTPGERISINDSGRGEYFVYRYYNGNYYTIGRKLDQKSTRKLQIYFVYTEGNLQEELTKVDTLDNGEHGISMTMTDLKESQQTGLLGSGGPTVQVGNTTYYNVEQGILNRKLDNDGYPTLSGSSYSDTVRRERNASIKSLFSNSNTKSVNHLLSEFTYNSTGYYEYSSFSNYAYLSGNNFIVYDALGTPSNDSNSYFYNRGNFFPYNYIRSNSISSNRNLYGEDGERLEPGDANYYESLYLAGAGRQSVNYHFAMTMEAEFYQPENGIVKYGGTSSDMIYEFNGDDDLWVFIDNILVLDIGGIHDAHSGYINFANGDVHVELGTNSRGNKIPVYETTLKNLYWEARMFPDGTPWTDFNDEKVEEFFAGDTFTDYTRHAMKMFYMERGAGASNLHIRFNLQTVPDGTITVSKELDNTDKEKYANEDFKFELWTEKKSNEWTEENPVYTGKYEQVTKSNMDSLEIDATLRQNGVDTDQELKWSDDGTIFLLKPDQSVVFSGLKAIQKYYVKEVGVESNRYDEIRINKATVIETDGDGNIISKDEVNGMAEITSSKNTVYQRPIITFTNNCSAANHRELHIIKVMSAGQSSNDKFTFKIQLEGLEGNLVDYDGAYYLIRDGEYYYYNDEGNLVSNGNQSKICGYADDGIISNILVDDKISITGLLSGTEFNVTEVNPNNGQVSEIYDSPQYKVETAENPYTENGASGTIILGQGKDAEVTVTNSFKTETITVTKDWSDNGTFSGETNTPNHNDDVIYVGLYRYLTSSGPESAQPVSDTSYSILNSENSWKDTINVTKDEEYSYTVKELESVDEQEGDFTIAGHTYSAVIEGGNIQVNGHDYQVNVSQDENDVNKFTITNTRLNTITINKQDNNDKPLSGATFKLEKLDDAGNPIHGTEQSITTGTDGTITFTDLEDGRYRITETQSPAGHSLLANPIEVELPLVLKEGESSDNTGTAEGVVKGDETYYYDLTYTVINNKLFTMPEAGGRNIFLLTLAGTAMIALAGGSAIYYRRRRGAHSKTGR